MTRFEALNVGGHPPSSRIRETTARQVDRCYSAGSWVSAFLR